MSLELWLGFVLASTIVVMLPGPTILLVLSYALGQGRKVAIPMAVGVVLGDLAAMLASLLGLGVMLRAAPELYLGLKIFGALWLLYLAWRLWWAGGSTKQIETRAEHTDPMRMAGHAFVVTALNPKTLTFFISFLPQFLDEERDVTQQMAVMAVTFMALAAINVTAYVTVATTARALVSDAGAMRRLHRIGACIIGAAGVWALGTGTG